MDGSPVTDRPRMREPLREVSDNKVSAPSTPPQLLWPSIAYGQGVVSHDDPHFPDPDKIYERLQAIESGTEGGLRAFELAVTAAAVRVLVLDPHFDRRGAEILRSALSLSQAQDVRLLTGRRHLDDQERSRLAKLLTQSCNERRLDRLQVEARWSASLDRDGFPFLHDRFAIVDGALWHFGATVGGGYAGLTAASGPWPAAKSRAIIFFDECWRRCNA